jgi:hypothetical protein
MLDWPPRARFCGVLAGGGTVQRRGFIKAIQAFAAVWSLAANARESS